MTRARIAVLASGGGSNLQALIDHHRLLGDARASDVVVVASERASTGALSRARHAGIETSVIASRFGPDGQSLLTLLAERRVDLVVLAGYLQLIPPDVIDLLPNRIVNVHPAPLPLFGGKGMYGSGVHRAVIDAAVTHSGPTVHFVNEEYDRGPAIAHWPVPVVQGDDEHTLARRVLRAEHILYPRVIESVARSEHGLGVILLPFDETLSEHQLARVADAALGRSD